MDKPYMFYEVKETTLKYWNDRIEELSDSIQINDAQLDNDYAVRALRDLAKQIRDTTYNA